MTASNLPESFVTSQVALMIKRNSFKNCHITVPDLPSPIGAIQYQENFYSYFRYFSSLEAAQRVAQRLISSGNVVVLTQVPKGLVLWIFESDAQRVKSARV
jgi:hypothetical protein